MHERAASAARKGLLPRAEDDTVALAQADAQLGQGGLHEVVLDDRPGGGRRAGEHSCSVCGIT